MHGLECREGWKLFGTTVVREMNAREKQAYQKYLLGRNPPSVAPPGYKIVPTTQKLAPGMPAKVGFYGQWVDAEILTNATRVTVKLQSNGSLRLLNREGWIAAAPEVLQKIETAPGSYKPSILVLPNSTTPVPDGYLPITAEMPMFAGVPVKAIWHQKYTDATVMSVDGSQLLVHIDNVDFAFDQKMDRGTVLIAKETLPKLNEANAKESFAKRVPKITSMEEQQMATRDKIESEFARAQQESEKFQKKLEADIAKQNAEIEEQMRKGLEESSKLPLLLQPAPVTPARSQGGRACACEAKIA